MRFTLLMTLFLAVHAHGATLTVSAAASLADVIGEINALFVASHPGVKVDLNTGSSGGLSGQIEQGAPADVFLSAGPLHFDPLVKSGSIEPSSRLAVARNSLVLIGPKGSRGTLATLESPTVKRIALGTPESVPAGACAMEAMSSVDLAEKLRPKFVFTRDVRQALAMVETGNADAAFVYVSDLKAARSSVEWEKLSPKFGVEYLAGVVARTKEPELARSYVAFLATPEAQKAFEKWGFRPPEKGE